ncbi:MAG: hypothetical protein ACXVAT_18410, partial [Isosphaeraceae bacterium]
AYAPVTYSGAGYSAASSQMASYAPMSAGYAMPVASYHLLHCSHADDLRHARHDDLRHARYVDLLVRLRQTGIWHLPECRAWADGSRRQFPGTGKHLPTRLHQPGDEQHA